MKVFISSVKQIALLKHQIFFCIYLLFLSAETRAQSDMTQLNRRKGLSYYEYKSAEKKILTPYTAQSVGQNSSNEKKAENATRSNYVPKQFNTPEEKLFSLYFRLFSEDLDFSLSSTISDVKKVKEGLPYRPGTSRNEATFLLSFVDSIESVADFRRYWDEFPLFDDYAKGHGREFSKIQLRIMQSIARIPFEKREPGWYGSVKRLTSDEFYPYHSKQIFWEEEKRYKEWSIKTGDHSELFLLTKEPDDPEYENLFIQDSIWLLDYNRKLIAGQNLLPKIGNESIYREREKKFTELFLIRLEQWNRYFYRDSFALLEKNNQLKLLTKRIDSLAALYRSMPKNEAAVTMFLDGKDIFYDDYSDTQASWFLKECLKRFDYIKNEDLYTDILKASGEKHPDSSRTYLNGWETMTVYQLLHGEDKFEKNSKKHKRTNYVFENLYIDLMRFQEDYDSLLKYFSNFTLLDLSDHIFKYTEALCQTGKMETARNTLQKMQKEFKTIPVESYRYIIQGMIYFYENNYKDAWKYFTKEKNPVPFIFNTEYDYLLICCAKELNKADYNEWIDKIRLRPEVPSLIYRKYGELFKSN